MKKIFFFSLIVLIASCKKENSSNQNLPDQTLSDVSYSTDASQKMDVYLPAGRNTDSTRLMILVHGGAWISGDKSDFASFIPVIQQKFPGYAIANINYRLGFDTSAGQKDIAIIMACYRATQDASSALRYLMHHAKIYHIDTTAVFLSGESAGGVTSLAEAYMSQQQWDALFPMIHQSLGAIKESGNELNASYQLKGIISMWGGILDTALISSNISKQIPVALIQSQSDEVIPYQHSKHK